MAAESVQTIAWLVLRALLPTLLAVGPIWALLHERRDLLTQVAQDQRRSERDRTLRVPRLEYLTGQVDQAEAVLRDDVVGTRDASHQLSTLIREVKHLRATLPPPTDDNTRWIHARWQQLGDRLMALTPNPLQTP